MRLRATGDVRSRGKGPMELRGMRNGPRSMRVRQRIYKTGRGHITVGDPGEEMLHFTDVGAYFGGSYWKVPTGTVRALVGRETTPPTWAASGSAPS